MPVAKCRTIDDAPAPKPGDTPSENLRLAFTLSKTCLALARAGAGLAEPEGEKLPSGRVWRSRGPQLG